MSKIEYLGHYIEDGCLVADEKKVAAVAEWPVPKTVKELKQFLGLANYYNRFIRNFTDLAVPLKSSAQSQGSSQQNAFDALNPAHCNPPVLQLLNFEHNFFVETDASKFSISGTLMQDVGKGLKPVQYFSRKLNSAESRYLTHDCKLLAIVYSFKRFRPYLAHGPTTVIPDHKPLKYMPTQPNLNDRQVRQTQHLAQYHYVIQYKPGHDNIAADSLLRRPDYNTPQKKNVHFADQRGFTLCIVHVFDCDHVAQEYKVTKGESQKDQHPGKEVKRASQE